MPKRSGKRATRRRSVALLIETSNAYARGILDGIIDYVRGHERWAIDLPEQERGAKPPKWLADWQGDGVIARIETDEIARFTQGLGVPVVDVSAARQVPDIPWVETDDGAIAKLAAEHLLERGFRELAFCGEPEFNWSQWRRDAFRDEVIGAGAAYHEWNETLRLDPSFSWQNEKERLAGWLQQLPRPIGIMACYDIKAQQLLEACRDLNIAVPEEMAVIGVDNDRLICDLSDPPLSSVIPNTRRTGYEAAALLDRMMSGEATSARAHLIEPVGVMTRQSTDVLAIDDSEVARALRFIREHAWSGIQVGDVIRHTGLSRRVLEARFRRLLGRTPHQEIVNLRIKRVKQLLVDTDLPLQAIAPRAGFQHAEYLSVVFRRETGVTPGQFRRAQMGG